MKILKKSIPLWLLLVVIAGLGAGSFLFNQRVKFPEKEALVSGDDSSKLILYQGKKGQFTRRLLLADSNHESKDLDALKNSINQSIQESYTKGGVQRASVYCRFLNSGEWISVNGDQTFSVASIMKVLTLIYHLKKADATPNYLDQQVLISADLTGNNIQTLTGAHTSIGKKYTIAELLKYMIVHSDNNATAHLNALMNYEEYIDIMRDMNLPIPTKEQTDYRLTTEQTSRFLRVIYRCSMLSTKYSEYAMQLLTTSSYHAGLIRNIKDKVFIAHKFGERFLESENQLHETALFFHDTNPFLITVMTAGPDTAQEAALMARIGQQTYDFVNRNN